MNFPLISDYIETIKVIEENFDALANLHFVKGMYEEPVMTSNDFVIVFKSRKAEEFYVKCLLKD